ncbi:hypothetical protein BV898_13696 [Hypsibius exemplaris]|uniref:Receptor ligand binding region domain-containing protein n=1 Tax=Hypsibius exemplaris TaxID=2072580 RepID=A0A1W0WA20_HYPEX|nr:hypothetical protein BV898_13696 [Hypsibius exemplaris]
MVRIFSSALIKRRSSRCSCALTVLRCSVLLLFCPGDCLDVELLIYGLWPPILLQSIPLSGPGFDVAIAEVNRDLAGVMKMQRSGATFSNLRDRTLFPTTLATGPFQFELYSIMFRKVCETFNWTNVGLAYDLSRTLPFPLKVYQTLMSSASVRTGQIQLQLFPIPAAANLTELLQKVTLVSRGTPVLIRRLMMEALKQNKTTPEYVWISVDLPEQTIGPITWFQNDTDDQVAFRAFAPLKQMITCFDHDPAENRLLKEEIRLKAQENYGYKYPLGRAPSEFATSSYATIKMLANVIHQSIQGGVDFYNGRLFTQQFLNRSHSAGPIGDLYIDADGERQNKICLMKFDSSTGKFARTMFYDYTQSSLQEIPDDPIQWNTTDNKPPRDTPRCGFLGDAFPCVTDSTTVIVAGVTSALTVFALLFGCILRDLMRRTHLAHSEHGVWWRLENSPFVSKSHHA